MIATTVNSVRGRQSGANARFCAARLGSERAYFPVLGALRPLKSQQSTTHHIQIRQSTGDEEPVGILHDAAVANLGETEHTLEDADGVLHACAHAGARAIEEALARREVAVAATALLREVLRSRS